MDLNFNWNWTLNLLAPIPLEELEKRKVKSNYFFNRSWFLQVIALVLRTGWATEHGAVLSSKLSETVTVPSDSHRRLNHLYTVLLACGICASIYVICIRVSWTPNFIGRLQLFKFKS